MFHSAFKSLLSIIGRFRYIAWVKCPYRVAGKASALCAGKRYTEIGLFPCLGGDKHVRAQPLQVGHREHVRVRQVVAQFDIEVKFERSSSELSFRR